MNRDAALARAAEHFDSGAFLTDLARRVGYRTESQAPDPGGVLREYLTTEMIPSVERLGFSARVVDNPVSPAHPFLVAHRREGADMPTLLTYGHGDVQLAHPQQWRAGLDPWQVTVTGDRWYGRGVADNKGQHSVNLAALGQVIAERGGRLGYNVTLLLDMAEEIGSPGLTEVCAQLSEELAADILIASDGPRLSVDRPTVFLGSRGTINVTFSVHARDESHHSGNWGGVLANPATVVVNAVASLIDGHGQLLAAGLRPPVIPESVRTALADIDVDQGPDSPPIDEGWGEPGLSPSERLFGWNTLEILAMTAGNPDGPVNAIPGSARVHCQLRFVVGTAWEDVGKLLRAHFDRAGFEMVDITIEHAMAATRLDPDNPWVRWTLDSLKRTTGTPPALLPNLGGSLPNEAFAHVLGLPTVWIPHSYPGCAQHAPNEHLPAALVRETMQVMAGLFWDLSELTAWPPRNA